VPLVPVLYKQVGWMPCVACSDSRRLRLGQMWLGHKRNGTDDFVPCPACGGTGEVARHKVLDARTGEEIDYETFGRDEFGNPIQPT
jgi:hypothetical protein